MAPTSPIPPTLLTLRLSSPSFLETILTSNSCPVYSTETYGSTTSLSRCDPSNGLTLIANIHWPDRHHSRPPTDRCGKGKGKSSASPSSAQLFIDGSTISEDDLLKRNRLNTSRKFRIPGYSHSLKWRRVQGVFQCTTSAGTPVAVFEPAIITARARLNVFVSTLPGLPSPQPQAEADGVSSVLVDYLLVTALLLLTHPEDWHGFTSAPSPTPVPALPGRAALPHLDIPASFPHSHSHMHGYRVPQARCVSSSSSTPVSPITSAVSETSCFSFPSSSSSDTLSQHWEQRRERERERFSAASSLMSPVSSPSGLSSRRSVASLSCVDAEHGHALGLAGEFKDAAGYEPPPPYEEIQWTVRVRQPRRLRP